MMGLGEETKFDSKSKTPKPVENGKISLNQGKSGKCFQILISNEEKTCVKTEAFRGQTICDKLRFRLNPFF